MEQLDNNKPPKIGSQGEKYRDLQLIIQLPKQVSFRRQNILIYTIAPSFRSFTYFCAYQINFLVYSGFTFVTFLFVLIFDIV